MRRIGFTMIELIFVIVIMGIIGKFGTEFLAQAYRSFIFSSINNKLQADSEMAVEAVASRLQYRIKDSIIARDINISHPSFQALAGSTLDKNATVLEWVGTDVEGFRGNSLPDWSGIIDIAPSTSILLNSPETNTTALNTQIGILAHASGTGINNAAIYFVGSDSDIQSGYGWDSNPIINQNATMHPIRSNGVNNFTPVVGNTGGVTDNNFTGVDVFEYYQLAWTAYAVVHSADGNLTLFYDYQPWDGQSYTDGKGNLLMQNVSTFRFKAVGSVVKIQVCVKTDLVQNEVYSLCKEKTVF